MLHAIFITFNSSELPGEKTREAEIMKHDFVLSFTVSFFFLLSPPVKQTSSLPNYDALMTLVDRGRGLHVLSTPNSEVCRKFYEYLGFVCVCVCVCVCVYVNAILWGTACNCNIPCGVLFLCGVQNMYPTIFLCQIVP